MTTTWQIANIKRLPSNGLVIEVTYIMNFVLETKTDRRVGVITLTGDPQDPGFVPYESLTEEIVIGWVQNNLGAQTITDIQTQHQTRLQAVIDRETNPEFLTGLPWNN